LIAVGILSFINAWNEYLFGVFLTSKSAIPISVGATFFATNLGVDWGVASAVLMMSVLPPMCLGLVSYRYIGRSLTTGAVKG
jgi:multiple sugar transport system permease protein